MSELDAFLGSLVPMFRLLRIDPPSTQKIAAKDGHPCFPTGHWLPTLKPWAYLRPSVQETRAWFPLKGIPTCLSRKVEEGKASDDFLPLNNSLADRGVPQFHVFGLPCRS